jgi:nucleoside phosphorylase
VVAADAHAAQEDLSTSSVAEVCHYLRVPFLCIRSGSNRTQNSPDNDYRTLSPFAARQAALFTVSLVRELAKRPPVKP